MGNGTRTHDDRHHKPGLYQLSYTHHNNLGSTLNGAPGRTRTCNLRLRRLLLYPVELQAQIKNYPYYLNTIFKIGRGREIRTPDILHPKQARYQTALYPVSNSLTSKLACRSKEARIIRLMINYVKHILSFYYWIITA